ncbi:hypothetical protein I4U23_010707 [Adineta vaga]|nr:hypothetical protein I4U23_010707 [Adineta vaga]
MGCSITNPTSQVTFNKLPTNYFYTSYVGWKKAGSNDSLVNGFFTGCTPLEALLQTTFDCLYSLNCIQLLITKFPNLNKINNTWNDSLLSSNQEKKSIYEYLNDLFVQQWSIDIDYLEYFIQCSPSFCTYTSWDHTDFSHAITLLISLYGLCFALLLFHSLNTNMILITKTNPSLTIYNDLQMIYSTTLQCPCSNLIIPYKTFISFSPRFHQICSSDFVNSRWLLILKDIQTKYQTVDWRNTASSQFQLLSDLCKLSNETITDAIDHFLLQVFVISNVLNENEFYEQMNTTIDQFSQSTIDYFDLFIETTEILKQVDQPYFGSIRQYGRTYEDQNPIGIFTKNETTDKITVEVIFQLIGPRYSQSQSSLCICAINASCQDSIGIYDIDKESTFIPIYINRYIVPGLVIGCSTIDSFMLSTFQCYYNDSDCFSILMKYSEKTYIHNVEYPEWFHVQPLIYNSTSSRFPPTTTISTIIKEIMIEKWNVLSSYEQFYQSCRPKYCSYLKRTRIKTFFDVMITFISTIGGFTLSLRLILPRLIKFIFYLINKFRNRNQREIRTKGWNRIKEIIQKLMRYIFTYIRNLNIYYLRDFSSRINPITVIHLGQWATQLFQRYNDEIRCPCSSIASTYNWSIKINVLFHEICSSSFSSEEQRNNFTLNIISNLSSYSQNDYRRFLSSHLQFLERLCQLSHQTVNISIQQFLSSLFFTPELLPEEIFNQRLHSIIEQTKSKTPKTFNRLFFLIRSINHGNAMISTYGTNFQYYNPWDISFKQYVPTRALIYDNNCSCGLSSSCIIQANFIDQNSLEIIPIQGLKMGCLPSESFRFSTFECFYNQSCIQLIQYYLNITNTSHSFSVLSSTNKSRFSINTNIDKLIDELFIEEWNIIINYSSYFSQCLPMICSYNYIQQYDILYSITMLFGLQGGLTIVLQWICPKLIQIIYRIYRYKRKRRDTIQPISINEQISIENRDHSTSNNELISTNHLVIRCSFKMIIICILLMIIITILIIYSIQLIQIETKEFLSTSKIFYIK